MERYTSPDLSRELYDAGMPDPKEFQNVRCGSEACHRAWGGPDAVHECTEDDCVSPCYRALDLTDVLEELRRLGAWRWNINADTFMEPGKAIVCTCHSSATDKGKMSYCFADSPVEAAGLVLLALLKERAK